ncbi:MAG TPA: hypothetical protein VFZ00_35340 [Solirubrobacter sp.]|nr:hypothetical protein [Solirubrobacter sp.]
MSDRPAPLIVCEFCDERLMNPVAWEERGQEAWWIRLRCGACAWTREVIASNAEAARLERDLEPGVRTIDRTVRDVDRERMRREADAFIQALERDLIDPSDFGRRLHH